MRFLFLIFVWLLTCAWTPTQIIIAGPQVITKQGAAIDLNFSAGGYPNSGGICATWGHYVSCYQLTSIIRASSKYCNSNDGFFFQVANGLSCIGQGTGYLIEEARTNSVSNNSTTGAATGTPGTMPTGHVTSFPTATLTSNIGALGATLGVETIRFDVSGTPNATTNARLDAWTGSGVSGVVASAGQVWTVSAFLAALNVTNLTELSLILTFYDSGGSTLSTSMTDLKASVTASLTRFSTTFTAPASTAFIRPALQIGYTNGSAVNTSITEGWPQLELGAFVTSPIRTTNAAATRAADVVTASGGLLTLLNTGVGSMYAQTNTLAGFTAAAAILATNNVNQMMGRVGTSASIFTTRMNNVTNAATLGSGTFTTTPVKAASSWDSGNNSAVANNGTLITSANGLTVTTPFGIGNVAGVQFLNGPLARLALWPSRLPDATLQAITQ